MSNTPVSSGGGFDVVVGTDGTLTVPAAEFARMGVRPGAHLRLVVDSTEDATPRRGRSGGKLAHVAPASVIREWARALDEDRAERRAAYGDVASG
jgi:hypothetical protein